MAVNDIHTPITPLAVAAAKRQALRRRERELRIVGNGHQRRHRQQLAHVARAAHLRIERLGGHGRRSVPSTTAATRPISRIARRCGFAGHARQHRRLDQAELIRAAADDGRFAHLGIHLAIEQLLVFLARDGQVARGVRVFALHLRRRGHVVLEARRSWRASSAFCASRLPSWLSMALICVRSCMPTGVPSDISTSPRSPALMRVSSVAMSRCSFLMSGCSSP